MYKKTKGSKLFVYTTALVYFNDLLTNHCSLMHGLWWCCSEKSGMALYLNMNKTLSLGSFIVNQAHLKKIFKMLKVKIDILVNQPLGLIHTAHLHNTHCNPYITKYYNILLLLFCTTNIILFLLFYYYSSLPADGSWPFKGFLMLGGWSRLPDNVITVIGEHTIRSPSLTPEHKLGLGAVVDSAVTVLGVPSE